MHIPALLAHTDTTHKSRVTRSILVTTTISKLTIPLRHSPLFILYSVNSESLTAPTRFLDFQPV